MYAPSLPWDLKLESAPDPSKKEGVKFHSSLQKHYCFLDLHEVPNEEVQTGIICDINHRGDSHAIQKFIANGMTVARIVLKDMEPEVCTQIIHSIRQAVFNFSAELAFVYPLAILVDIKGPTIITGNLQLDDKLEILTESKIKLTTEESWKNCGSKDCLYIEYNNLTSLKQGDIIYIDSLNGPKIKLSVSSVGEDSVDCNVILGGILGPNMIVRIAQVPREIESTTIQAEEKSRGDASSQNSYVPNEDILEHITQQVTWAVASDVDGFLISNTESVHDILEIREIVKEKGKHMLVFACIDTMTGFDHFDEILAEADGIHVDRNILATSLPVERVFLATKIIVSKCNWIGKPCIVKALLSDNMPSICVTDIANLIIDGVDVLGLEMQYGDSLQKHSQNTEWTKVAEQTLGAVAVICRLAETTLWKPRIYGNPELMQRPINDPTRSLCISAVELAMRSLAVTIICLTNSGRTAKLLSHVRPTCPVIAVTRAFHTARQLRLWRGVRALHYFEMPRKSFSAEMDARVAAALEYCKLKHILKAGDPFVVVMGSHRDVGYSDSIRLLFASARTTVMVD